MKGTETLGVGRAVINVFKSITKYDGDSITNVADIPDLDVYKSPEDKAMCELLKRNTVALKSGRTNKNNKSFASSTNNYKSMKIDNKDNSKDRIMKATIVHDRERQ